MRHTSLTFASVVSAGLLACAGLWACTGICGCAGPPRLENPADWPQRWDDRTLRTTAAAYVYGRGIRATDDINRLMADVARDFERDAGTPPPPVTVIVRDTGDSAWPMGTEDWLVAAARTKAELAPAKADEPFDPKEAVEDAREATEEAGIALDVLVEMMPLMCDRTTLREGLGAPAALAERSPAALVLPTKALVRRNAKKMLKGALEKEEIGPVAQVFLAPILAIVEAKLVDALCVTRNVAVYEYWAYTNARWTVEEKQTHVTAYGGRKLGEAMPGFAPSVNLGREKEKTDVEQIEYFDNLKEGE